MGKRSDKPKIDKDAYQTIDGKAFAPLLPHIRNVRAYAEPCLGEGRLVGHLDEQAPWMECTYKNDIGLGEDAISGQLLESASNRFDAIITNPPWTRKVLHPMISKFISIAPTWLLFDADWPYTMQDHLPIKVPELLDKCVKIVAVGRLKWIPDTTMSGKDNCAWYYFRDDHEGGPRFYGK